jgi:hypothetical protein
VDTKKEIPPHRKGIPLASIVAVLTGVASLLIFLTGKTNLPEILKVGETTETATAAPTATLAPTVPAFPTAEVPPTPTATLVPTPVPLAASPPSDDELETVPSIWPLTNFHELAEPGSNAYTVQVTHDSVWLWDCYFCTTDETFHAFLATLDLEFRIDGIRLAEEFIRVYDRPGVKGWICRNWSTKLTGWPRDRSVFLEIHYTHKQATSDGKNDFASGEYSQTIVVVVKG